MDRARRISSFRWSWSSELSRTI